MAQILSVSIDLSKIDKTKIQKFDKAGNPFKNNAQYYNLDISVNDDIDQYGKNVKVMEPQTKEQREAKGKRTFIGNGKIVWSSNGATQNNKSNSESPATTSAADDDLPF